MPRIGRIYQRAMCYHVMNRGINRGTVFADEIDFEVFKELVMLYKERTKAKVYHWVLMGNHFHLVIEIEHERLRGFIGGIEQKYVWHNHHRHGTSGVFWQGRFKSKPVEIGGYLVSCGRYIERNPVRAGLVVEPWSYRWSSAGHYVKSKDDEVTDTNKYLGKFGGREREMYAEALMSGVDEAMIRGTNRFRVIGTPEYASKLQVSRGRHKLRRGRPANQAVRINE